MRYLPIILAAALALGLLAASSKCSAAAKSTSVAKSRAVSKPSQQTINWGKRECGKADKLLEKGDYERARDVYSQVLWKLPASPRAKAGLKKAEAAIRAKQNRERELALKAAKTGTAEAQERMEIDRKLRGEPDGIDWRISYSAGLAEARQLNRFIMMDCTADWCKWCKKLDAETWRNPQVIALSRSFVCLKISNKDRSTMAALGVRSYPTIIFLDAGGQEVKRCNGYQDAREMLAAMNEVLAPR